MGLQAKAGFIGIVTATGEMAAAQGALKKADNVTLRRQGALASRSTWSKTTTPARTYAATFWYGLYQYYVDGNNVLYRNEVAVTLPDYPSPPSTVGVRADCFSWKESRKNLYFAAATGVYKLTSDTATKFLNTGLSPSDAGVYSTALLTTGSTILPNNSQVAYRLVAKYTDANGVIIRSRPSGAVLVSNTAGAARTPQLFVAMDVVRPTNPVDEIEIYRTRIFPTTASVDDEMQLVGTMKASQFTTGTAYFEDNVTDAQRTTTLYTSPSRGGIENANDRPPGAAVMETFRGHLFFGNLVSPQRFIVSFKFAATNLAGLATGIGSRNVTGNITSGSLSITSVSNVTGIERGMVVIGTGAVGTAFVTNIVGSTVTTNVPAGSTGTGTSLQFIDALIINGTPYALGRNSAFAANIIGGNGDAYFSAYELTPANPGYDVTLVVETKARGGNPMALTATHGGEMNPPLSVYGGAVTSSTSDKLIHGLAWSEPDEPEHVPPKNYARVGDGSKAILGLTAMRDSLLIWKEDGLFRLTGAVSSGFRIDPFDPTVQCILPGSIRRLRESVMALTSLGIVRVTDTAADVVSAPISPDLAYQTIRNIRDYAYYNGGVYKLPSTSPCICATADEGNGEYWLLAGPPWENTLGGAVLVYNADRQGFTTYSFGPYPSDLCLLAQNGLGQPAFMTPTGNYPGPDTFPTGDVTARVQTHALLEPGLVGKLWTHILAGFSVLGKVSSVQVTYTASEALPNNATITQSFDAPVNIGGDIAYPFGMLLRHIVPTVMRRAWSLWVELSINSVSSAFVLEVIGAESRENIQNKDQPTATGST